MEVFTPGFDETEAKMESIKTAEMVDNLRQLVDKYTKEVRPENRKNEFRVLRKFVLDFQLQLKTALFWAGQLISVTDNHPEDVVRFSQVMDRAEILRC